jgi:hypothetical protein
MKISLSSIPDVYDRRSIQSREKCRHGNVIFAIKKLVAETANLRNL